jgi:hypothetical protein
MTNWGLVRAFCYQMGLFFLEKKQSLKSNSLFCRMMNHCRPDWAQWKTAHVMKSVDNQGKQLMHEWVEDHRNAMSNKLAKKAREMYPKAKVTPVLDAIVPSVIIEEEGDSLLGGPMRITWRIDGQFKRN